MMVLSLLALALAILGRVGGQDCQSPGASYRNVKLWQLRVPSSGSSTLVHALRYLSASKTSDCVRHSSCERHDDSQVRHCQGGGGGDNNGDNNGVDGSRHCCCHVPAIVLDTLGVKNVFSLEASAVFASKWSISSSF